MNTHQLTRSLLLQPEQAFASLRAQPRYTFPLLLLSTVTLLAICIYFSQVDLQWLQSQLLTPAQGKPEEATPVLSPQMLIVTSVIGALVALVGGRLLEGGYYFLAGRLTQLDYSFNQWLALACWASLPLLLLPLMSLGMLGLYPSGQMLQEELNALSLNELFFQVPAQDPWYVLLNSLSVLHPWSWWLSAVGVKTWSGRGWGFSTAFTLAPWVLMYGIWAMMAGL